MYSLNTGEPASLFAVALPCPCPRRVNLDPLSSAAYAADDAL